MKWETVTEQDKYVIRKQIQRQPRNLLGVVRRCKHDCPQVSVNHPLPKEEQDAVFFPTVFWLTCPEAVRQISRIEDHGFIQTIQSQVKNSRQLRSSMQDAHQEYVYIRRALLDGEIVANRGKRGHEILDRMERVGIGGMKDLGGIKCLHMHYAHYLATRNNPVGELIDRMISFSNSKWRCNTCFRSDETAGVAELADAADLKSAEPKGSCRFEPGPRHQPCGRTLHGRTLEQLGN